ncbi:hypothetical protein [Halomarina rubra]|uniref:Uncharacterized protein n=1 Tax=Halomarina rubra TaxID=2071873 RepID=A0ABD6ARZ3_9EURY|nr:hypothetical protein [Halomarina rubra]
MKHVQKTLHASTVVTRSVGKDGSEQEYLKVPISSTATDRDGDEFSKDGVRNLQNQIKEQSVPVFGNHGMKAGGGLLGGVRYDWKDIIGSLDDAEVEERDGDVEVLNGFIRPNPENERGQQLLRYVKADMPVGFSIGFGVANKEDKPSGGMVFHESDLMEVSSVGVQSNRESVANAADTASALAKAVDDLDDVDVDEATLAKELAGELVGRSADGGDLDDEDPTEWARKLFAGDADADDDSTEQSMDDELKEKLNRFLDTTEETQDELKEITDRLDALEAKDEDDEEDDDDEEEDDDEKSTTPDDEKTSITVSSDDEQQVKALLEEAEDGELDLSESKTVIRLEDGEEADNDGTAAETGGLI